MKKILFSILILLVIGVGVGYASFNNENDKSVKLNSKIEMVSQTENMQDYIFSVQPIEDGEQKIKFSLKNDINIVLEKQDTDIEDIPQDALSYDIPVRKKGEVVSLTSKDELSYPIQVHLDKLTPGKYELEVMFSADNVIVDKQNVDITVK